MEDEHSNEEQQSKRAYLDLLIAFDISEMNVRVEH